jgi:6-pyruvoyl-tetrahydropterin synthase
MLFALLGIQISYPQIFRLLTQDHNYVNWSKSFANKNNLDAEVITEKLAQYEENELVDELWEQIVWGFCQKEPYLKARAFDVLKILNLLRDIFKDDLQEEIEKAMEFASITSVDDDAESIQATQKVGKKVVFNELETKLEQLHEIGYNPDGIDSYRLLFNSLMKSSDMNNRYRHSLARTGASFNNVPKNGGRLRQLIYIGNPQKRTFGINLGVQEFSGVTDELYSYVLNMLGKEKSENAILGGVYKGKEHNNLELSAQLAHELGLENYQQLLSHISARVIESCDKYCEME